MTIETSHSKATEEVIKIPAIGLELGVRVDPSTTGGAFCFIDTVNAPGFGPPRHRHKETEVFRVMEGRYLFEVDGARFYADEGDVVTVPGGAAHAFVNVTDRPARQYILIAPGLDARAFFLGLADVMRDGRPDTAALNVFAKTWDVEFLGPPLTVPGA
ncbi:cupin domain-containing protein [Rhizobium metallidurans]|uniref:Quercetin dioxygenase-like cupin family protein n=1 Tax=Rhizobium metallidurans TaxID=1265931 RepID=A0A7W6CXF4_9HYPH|nr:cupin domain-containing protein [Rhizobium metallidurans]MBB3966637.1 quercetin dioxygenase-like cupin family protein [Rhizobium metallidurans]